MSAVAGTGRRKVHQRMPLGVGPGPFRGPGSLFSRIRFRSAPYITPPSGHSQLVATTAAIHHRIPLRRFVVAQPRLRHLILKIDVADRVLSQQLL